MKPVKSILFASLLIPATAAAQTPTTTGVEETPVGEMPGDETTDEASETRPSDTPAPPADEPADEGDAIPGAGIGIGLGWFLPTDVTVPNAASVRFRMASGLTFEAQVVLAFATQGDETTIAGTTDEQSSSQVDVNVALSVRKPLATRGRFQFVGIGAAGVGLGTDSNEDNGDETSSSTTISAGAAWGIGIDWFVRPGWSISLSGTNPILTWSQTSSDSGMGGVETKSSSFLIGAIWDPTISAMVHLYY